jgi:acetyltransferase-like isoleucine patch superfamily enzyme
VALSSARFFHGCQTALHQEMWGRCTAGGYVSCGVARHPTLAELDPRIRQVVTARLRTRHKQRNLQTAVSGLGHFRLFRGNCLARYGSNIELGERVFFNFNCIVLDVCRVRIGDYTLFGPAVQVLTPMHPLDAALRRKQEYGKPVDIGSDVWVGAGALILPGVTIGSGTVIGAGSVVTRDVTAGVFAAGNPCRVIREISPEERSSYQMS